MNGAARISRFRKAMKRPNLVLGVLLTGFIFLTGVAAVFGTPYATDGVSIAERLQPPSAAHWLGTDSLGRDLLSMLMKGAQNALLMGFVAVGIGLGVGVPAGLYTAMRKGLPSDAVRVLGRLPSHETVTGFEVVPVLARITRQFAPVPEAGEVAEVFSAPLAHVTDPARFRVEGRRWNGQRRHYYTVPFGPYYIWGATARMLRGLAARMNE